MAQLMDGVGSLLLRLAVGERPLTSKVLGQMKSQFDEWVGKANRLMADAIETKVNVPPRRLRRSASSCSSCTPRWMFVGLSPMKS